MPLNTFNSLYRNLTAFTSWKPEGFPGPPGEGTSPSSLQQQYLGWAPFCTGSRFPAAAAQTDRELNTQNHRCDAEHVQFTPQRFVLFPRRRSSLDRIKKLLMNK